MLGIRNIWLPIMAGWAESWVFFESFQPTWKDGFLHNYGENDFLLAPKELAGPTRREWGPLNLYIVILGMKLPSFISFPTKGQLENGFHYFRKSNTVNGHDKGNEV